MYDTAEEVRRGYHAHRNLEQILICIHDLARCFQITVRNERKYILKSHMKGLYVPNDMWREMYDFSSDAGLLVLASDFYNEEDYIRDYQQFIDFVKEKER